MALRARITEHRAKLSKATKDLVSGTFTPSNGRKSLKRETDTLHHYHVPYFTVFMFAKTIMGTQESDKLTSPGKLEKCSKRR